MEQFLYNLTHGYGYYFVDIKSLTKAFNYLCDNKITWWGGQPLVYADEVSTLKYNIAEGGCYIYYDGRGIYLREDGDVNDNKEDYPNGIINYTASAYNVDLI